jgi:hypothetical protein
MVKYKGRGEGNDQTHLLAEFLAAASYNAKNNQENSKAKLYSINDGNPSTRTFGKLATEPCGDKLDLERQIIRARIQW